MKAGFDYERRQIPNHWWLLLAVQGFVSGYLKIFFQWEGHAALFSEDEDEGGGEEDYGEGEHEGEEEHGVVFLEVEAGGVDGGRWDFYV